jgi:hypothetical protein
VLHWTSARLRLKERGDGLAQCASTGLNSDGNSLQEKFLNSSRHNPLNSANQCSSNFGLDISPHQFNAMVNSRCITVFNLCKKVWIMCKRYWLESPCKIQQADWYWRSLILTCALIHNYGPYILFEETRLCCPQNG